MSLSNYTRTLARRNGGIRTIGLIDQRDVNSITATNTSFTAITFSQGCCFSRYEFREDEAEFKENVTVREGVRVVDHELKFVLDKMGNNASQAIATLCEASENGMIAVLLTANGDTFVVGYSTELGRERPLRIASVAGTTGKQLAESTSELITLRSEDVTKAMPYTGDFEALFTAAS